MRETAADRGGAGSRNGGSGGLPARIAARPADESEVKQMPPFPNEYTPDNTDGAALTEYAAELLREINRKDDEE